MRKATLIVFTLFFAGMLHCNAQDLGYNTKDLGLEYIWTDNSPGVNLQVAFNAKIHHSIIASAGYKQAGRPIPNTINQEKGKGFGGSLGYRYYFRVVPKGIYLGVRAHIWSLAMYRTVDNASAKSNLVVAQPGAELGYTAIINDMAFFTLFCGAGQQFQVSAGDKTYGYGKGSVISVGLSGGIRF